MSNLAEVAIPLEDIRAAAARIADIITPIPLVPLDLEDSSATVWLKLENLQPIGSFKLRGAGNAMRSVPEPLLAEGVWTASAGNMAQGVAWVARRLGIPCRVVVPDHAPETKLEAITRLGAETIKVPFDEWWEIIISHEYQGMPGHFIHPVSDPAVMAGNGTIGLEILEDLPDVDTIIVPFGGGGLSTGIASAVKAIRPETRVLAAEVETAAPLAASLANGEPTGVEYKASFVDGIGGKSVLPDMWPRVSRLLEGSLVVSLEQVADAVRLLVECHRIVAEGAGAASVAAALAGLAGEGRIVCVVSGGNLGTARLRRILDGEVPD
jgi:threonine dehydratase